MHDDDCVGVATFFCLDKLFRNMRIRLLEQILLEQHCRKYQERRNCKTVVVEKKLLEGLHACPSVVVCSFALIFRTLTERAFIYKPLNFW